MLSNQLLLVCHLWPDFQTISIPSRSTVTCNLLPVSKETKFLWKSGPDGQCQSILGKPIMPSKCWDMHLRTVNKTMAPGGTWTLSSLMRWEFMQNITRVLYIDINLDPPRYLSELLFLVALRANCLTASGDRPSFIYLSVYLPLHPSALFYLIIHIPTFEGCFHSSWPCCQL